MTDIHGRFVWYELLTTDPKAAATFYTNVVGWTIQPSMPHEAGFAAISDEKGTIGRVGEVGKNSTSVPDPPRWFSYIGTTDVHATVDAAMKLGARLLMGPKDMVSVGRLAVLEDPQGAVFAVLTPSSRGRQKKRKPNAPATFAWHELHSSDVDAGWAFYQALFGWVRTSEIDMGPEFGTYRLFGQSPESAVGGMMTRLLEMPVSTWTYYITVADMLVALDRVRSNGGQVWSGPQEVPTGNIVATCSDAQGVAFGLSQAPRAD